MDVLVRGAEIEQKRDQHTRRVAHGGDGSARDPGWEPGVEAWAVQDSNLRPPACKAGALPAELTARAATDGSPAAGILARAAPID
jgi:hypothetical protein